MKSLRYTVETYFKKGERKCSPVKVYKNVVLRQEGYQGQSIFYLNEITEDNMLNISAIATMTHASVWFAGSHIEIAGMAQERDSNGIRKDYEQQLWFLYPEYHESQE